MTSVQNLTLEYGVFNTSCGYMNRKRCTDAGATNDSPGIACEIVSWSANTIDDAYTVS